MTAVAASVAGVSSFNTRTGAVTLTYNDVGDLGFAPLASPTFTGVPLAPTAAAGTTTQQLATTAFVMNALGAMVAGVSSFNTRSGAVTLQGSDITGAGGALLASPALTGNPTAPTQALGTANTTLATTAFVTQAIGALDLGVQTFNGRVGAITLTANDVTAAGGLANPSAIMTGTPTAPTAPPGTSTQQIATTGFVTTALSTIVGGAIVSTNPPANPQAGQMWWAPDLQTYIWTGTQWAIAVNPPLPDVGTLVDSAVDTKINSLSFPFLPLTGGTLTGALTAPNLTSTGTLSAAQVNVGSGTVIIDNASTRGISMGGPNANYMFYMATASNNFFLNQANIVIAQWNTNAMTVGARGLISLWDSGTVWGISLSGLNNWQVGFYTDMSTFYWNIASTAILQMNWSYGFYLNIGAASKPGGGAWGDNSDARIKEVFGNYQSGLAEIEQLQPKRYRYLGNDTLTEDGASSHHDTDREYIGLVAQDVEGYLPELVERIDGYIDKRKVSDLRRLDPTALTYALINAVKELNQRLKAVESGHEKHHFHLFGGKS
jgi:hypothetical protein